MENKNMKNIVKGMAAFCLLAFAFGCGIDDNLASPSVARIKFFHGVSDAPTVGVDLLVDGTPINLRTFLVAGTILPDDSFKYGAGFPANTDSSYISLLEGAHNIKVNAFGTATTVASLDVTVASGKTYTAFAVDSLAKVGFLVIEDKLPAPKMGKAWVRFANLSPNAGNVDVMLKYVKTVTGVLTTLDSSAVASGVAYKVISDFVEVKAPDSLTVEFRGAGTTKAAVTFPKSALVAGRCYTILARGIVGKSGLGTSSVIHGR
jgi:Domain of unknown function (DUF4397)